MGAGAKTGGHVQHEGWVSESMTACKSYISSASLCRTQMQILMSGSGRMTSNIGQLTTAGNTSVSSLIWWHTFTFWSCYLQPCLLRQFHHQTGPFLWDRGQAVFERCAFLWGERTCCNVQQLLTRKKKINVDMKDFVTQIDKSGLTVSLAVPPEWGLLHSNLYHWSILSENLKCCV